MSTATVRLSNTTAIELDALHGDRGTTRGVLVTLAGMAPYNCVVIPLDRVEAVIASLQLAARQAQAETA